MDTKKRKQAPLFAAALPKGAPTVFHSHVERKNLLDELSATMRVKRVMTGDVASLAGPKGEDVVPEEYSQAFAQVISLYPMNIKLNIREGDPICDSYRIHTSDTGSIWCLADGCNWGQRPFQAANRYVLLLLLVLFPSFYHYSLSNLSFHPSIITLTSHLAPKSARDAFVSVVQSKVNETKTVREVVRTTCEPLHHSASNIPKSEGYKGANTHPIMKKA